MLRRTCFAVLLVWVSASACAGGKSSAPQPSSSAAAGQLHQQLIGTWRLERFEDWDSTGAVTRAFGDRPAGYVVYDPTGHVSVHIMRTPPVPPFASGDNSRGTAEEVRAAYDAYVAYFGTYTVDEARSTVTHQVEGSLWPSYTGTSQTRPFRISGDTLLLGVPGQWERELIRVR